MSPAHLLRRPTSSAGPANPLTAAPAAWALVVAGLVSSGCSAVSVRVKDSLVHKLPVESRIDLLDAENSLFASIDALDEARDTLVEAEAEDDKAGDRIDEAKDQKSKAKDAKDPNAVAVADLAIAEAKLHRSYLDVALDVYRADVQVAEAQLDSAHGLYELARAQAVKRAAIQGSEKIKLEDYEAQVQRLDAAVKKKQATADKARSKAEDQRKTWQESRTALAKATGGAQGSAWVE